MRRLYAIAVAVVVASAVPSVARAGVGPAPVPFEYRGVIEGFYGPVWAPLDRRDLIRFLGQRGMNTYVYAPKSDRFQRVQWRQPWPAIEVRRFAQDVRTAREHGIDYVVSISPAFPIGEAVQGESHDDDICYSCPSDRAVLFAKLDSLWQIGVRFFMISFDDTVKVSSHAEDAVAYGVGDASFGHMNRDLLNAVIHKYGKRGGQVFTVPVDFSGTSKTAYLTALTEGLDPRIHIMWTGAATVSRTVTCPAARAYSGAIGGRKPILWDNFPVNDFATDKLMLGPYAGRAADLPQCLEGIVANPASQARANMIPLATVARYLRAPQKYDQTLAFEEALKSVGRGHAAALRRFVDNFRSTALDRRESVEFCRRRDAFLRALDGPRWPESYAWLMSTLVADERAAAWLRSRFPDRRFIAEISGSPLVGSDTITPRVMPPARGGWLARLAFNARNGQDAARLAILTRPGLSVSAGSQMIRGKALPPIDSAGAAGALRVAMGLRARDDGNPTNAYGDRVFRAIDTVYSNENRLDAFFDSVVGLLLEYQATAARASSSVHLTVNGRPVELASDGSFSARVTTPSARIVVTDGVGRQTERVVSVPH